MHYFLREILRFLKTFFFLLINKKNKQTRKLIYIKNKENKCIYVKKYIIFKYEFDQELNILKSLQEYKFFQIIYDYCSKEKIIITEYAGKKINKDNLPTNWYEQIKEIQKILIKKNIYHNDIKLDHFLVKDNQITLIDFGRATFKKPGFFPKNNYNNIINMLQN